MQLDWKLTTFPLHSTRVHCADPATYKRRVKSGGNKKEMFVEGWVEFLDKKNAKMVAEMLNSQPVGGWEMTGASIAVRRIPRSTLCLLSRFNHLNGTACRTAQETQFLCIRFVEHQVLAQVQMAPSDGEDWYVYRSTALPMRAFIVATTHT